MKKPFLFILAGAIVGPLLMGLLKIVVFAVGLAAIVGGGLYLMGDNDE